MTTATRKDFYHVHDQEDEDRTCQGLFGVNGPTLGGVFTVINNFWAPRNSNITKFRNKHALSR